MTDVGEVEGAAVRSPKPETTQLQTTLPVATQPVAQAPVAQPAAAAVDAPRWLPSPDAYVPYSLRIAAGWAWRLIICAAAVWVLGQVVGTLVAIIVAIFLALVISSLLMPLVDALDRAMPRPLAVATALLLGLLLVVAIVTFVVVAFIDQLPTLTAQVQAGISSILGWLESGPLRADSTQISTWLKQAQDWAVSNAAGFAGGIFAGLGSLAEVATVFALAFFSTIFFMLEGNKIWSWIISMLPRRSQEQTDVSGALAWQVLSRYIRGTVIISGTNAIVVTIALSIMKVPLPIPLGLLVFVGGFIPYVGAPVAMFAAAAVALAANGPVSFAIVIVLIWLIGQLEGNVLQPMIMSRQVQIYPLVVVLAVAIGTTIAGVFGAIVSVPLVSVMWAVTRYQLGKDPEHPKPAPYTSTPNQRVSGDAY